MNKIIIDTNVLLALFDSNDKHHERSELLREEYKELEWVLFDIVVAETLNTLARRLQERKMLNRFKDISNNLLNFVKDKIKWVSHMLKDYFDEVIILMNQTSGLLNFNDAFIALMAREYNIKYIASFDRDFDEINWLERKH